MSARPSVFARLAGIDRLEQRFDEQDRRSEERHEANVETLSELKGLALKTNGRVNEHDVLFAVIAKAEEEAAIIEAAKVRADAVVTANRLTWRQGLAFVTAGALVSGTIATLIAIFA